VSEDTHLGENANNKAKPTKAFTNMYHNAQVQVISNENYADFIG
jgi:hypothetical protein